MRGFKPDTFKFRKGQKEKSLENAVFSRLFVAESGDSFAFSSRWEEN